MATTDFPIDQVIEQVEARMKAPETSPLDIYVWSDGRVTGPPTSNESDDAKLVTLVTPVGGTGPDLAGIRATILKGVGTAPAAPIDVPVPAAGLEELPPAEAHSPSGSPEGR